MAPCELNFFSLQFLIPELYLVQTFMFGGQRIVDTFKPLWSRAFSQNKGDCFMLQEFTIPILILVFLLLLLPSVL